MPRLIITIFLLGVTLIGRTQAPDYMDLKRLYADKNYSKLVKASAKYTSKDKSKKDPAPYLWLSRGTYQLILEDQEAKSFKNDLKEAITALSKAMKYDEDDVFLPEHDSFIEEFKMFNVKLILDQLAENDYRAAYGWISKYKKISLTSLGADYLDGVCKFKGGDKSTAAKLWNSVDKELENITSIDTWGESDKLLLKSGIIQTVACFKTIKQEDKAKTLLNKTAPWFENDAEFKAAYDELINN